VGALTAGDEATVLGLSLPAAALEPGESFGTPAPGTGAAFLGAALVEAPLAGVAFTVGVDSPVTPASAAGLATATLVLLGALGSADLDAVDLEGAFSAGAVFPSAAFG